MSDGTYLATPGFWVIELIDVNREKNYVYVARYNTKGTWCTNDSFDLNDFEKKLGITLNKKSYDFQKLMIPNDVTFKHGG